MACVSEAFKHTSTALETQAEQTQPEHVQSTIMVLSVAVAVLRVAVAVAVAVAE